MSDWTDIANTFSYLPFASMSLEFMRTALLGLLLLAPSCGLLGVQVVNSRMAFFSDAVSHGAFAGLALGWFFNFNLNISLAIYTIILGIIVIIISRKSGLSEDTATGVVFSLVVAGGLAMLAQLPNSGRMIQSFVLGDILTISQQELNHILCLLALTLIVFVCFGNRMLLVGLQPGLAQAHGFRAAVYQYGFAIILALAVSIAVQLIGVLLVTALLILPAATARNIAASWGGMCIYAIIFSITGSVAGLLLSAESIAANTPSGAVIILVMVFMFILSLPLAWRKNRSQM